MTVTAYKVTISENAIDVVEPGRRPRKGRIAFDLAHDLEFSTDALRSYAFASWEPVIYDAMVLAAAVEFSDRVIKRPSRGWARRIAVRLPVHDPARWSYPAVSNSLHDALGFLTGDFWTLEFVKRLKAFPAPMQECLPFPRPTEAVIAYSDGMDSRAVAGLMGKTLGEKLVRVRVGPKAAGKPVVDGQLLPFTKVPYEFKASMGNGETTARSRGFKFALIGGLAAYLADAGEILIPESGQGAFGPALVTVSHAYPDYRNHPLFTARMTRFLKALLGKTFRFTFPRLWHTKGETLKEFAALTEAGSWRDTKSCWRDSRWSSLNGKLLQCGVCAACMLRRMSVHAAGLDEKAGTYICTNLSAPSFADAIHPDFTRKSPAFERYAIAGTLHLDHMADMATDDARSAVQRHALLTGMALGISAPVAEEKLVRMFERHAAEWNGFVKDLGVRSFVRKWTRASQ
ncbi:MAG: 7-cyano-7-deazaguanine synthase [Afipia sp.]|nr:7-cyano-7-deazaguanine synthase [Afipia sp.]